MSNTQPRIANYLSKKESQRLEFKGRDAVSDRAILPRAVCAMLNAVGGDIIVGLADDGQTIEPIADLDLSERVIRDRLASTIAPTPLKTIEVRPFADADVLLVRVPEQPEGTLFAVKSSEARLSVPVRIGDRVQPLDWIEIQQRIRAPRSPRMPSEPRALRQAAADDLREWIKDAEQRSTRIKAHGGLYVVLSMADCNSDADVPKYRRLLKQALQDPSVVGASRDYNFGGTTSFQLGHAHGGFLDAGDQERAYRWLRVSDDSPREIRFAQTLDGQMMWSPYFDADGRSGVFNPRALFGFVASLTDLAHSLATECNVQAESITGGLELTRLKGRRLPKYRLGVPGSDYDLGALPEWSGGDPGGITATHEWTTFLDRPHQLARDLVRGLYQHFYDDESELPYWDDMTRRFVFR